MVKYRRENGVDIVLYLDDGLGMSEGYSECQNISEFIKSSLELAEFLINEQKSIFDPVQRLEWLGLIWDSVNFSLAVSERRLNDAKESLDNILKKFPIISARQLAQFTGRIISMSPVMGNVTSLMTRHLYFAIENRKSRDSILDIAYTECVLAELRFWSDSLTNLNQKKFVNDTLPNIVVYSDASNVAAGAFTVEVNEKVFHSTWSEYEKNMSSTWRELRAIQLALYSFKSVLKNSTVKWHTDNQNCVKIINRGSTKMHLQCFAYDIFKFCSKERVIVQPIWVPRSENCRADFLSKMIDIDDWQTSPEFFEFMDNLWGPYTVDRFANFANSKLKRFNSKFWNPGSEAIDAFTQNWKNENNWIVPPIDLVSKSINHLVLCKAEGTLIVPKWPSSSFWTLLFRKKHGISSLCIGSH
ncbi:Hypothetical predicted protein [Mytilus galloprovincialis]|uniref:Reverse transcriptase RNase H-like domain-containing protein n=1 Tax=Mytilus galloprovincialis TaxID=29158 RepID=A0A8B6GUN8_MYTGA|nr:Hypothetical predicted protein [Mytilus galloprovincialis]